jgi:GNAT superfamily N-acetyltransferase
MIFTSISESAERGELLLVTDGFCRFHRRRDGVVTIREIIVLPFRRRTGVGRRLIAGVLTASNGSVLRARCPEKYVEANLFWPAMGFTLLETKDGINLWQRPAHP